MKIGRKLRELRIAKKLTQGDIENRIGLKRSYTPRIENELATPSVETLEKYAQALEIPLYRLFYAFATALSKMDGPAERSHWRALNITRYEMLLQQ